MAYIELATYNLIPKIEKTYELELAMHEKTFVQDKEALNRIETNFVRTSSDTIAVANNSEIEPKENNNRMRKPQLELDEVLISIKNYLAEELHMEAKNIDEDVEFVNLGMDSITGVTWVRKINNKFNTTIEATKVYSYPTLNEFSKYIKEEAEKKMVVVHNEPAELIHDTEISMEETHEMEIELNEVLNVIKVFLAEELHMQAENIDEDMEFINLGMDSITGVTWVRKINEKYKTSIEATKVYSYPTLNEFSVYIKEKAEEAGGYLSKPVASKQKQTHKTEASISSISLPKLNRGVDFELKKLTSLRKTLKKSSNVVKSFVQKEPRIAVIGVAGQFPKAKNVDAFWNNIAQGVNCISEVPEDRWNNDLYYEKGEPVPGKTNSKWMGSLEDYDKFDPLFFNLSPVEAESMDPQQRLFLQSCWHGIEDAGYNTKQLSGSKCGVFVGCGSGDYNQLSNENRLSAQGFTGGSTSILAARISYFLNLQGPCLSIDTACSSSLVAIATACDNLVAGNCDSALAGGVGVMATPSTHIMTAQSGMLSQDGKCYTFDQRANGFVPGEAVGVVMLKRLEDAEKDNDRIYGVIQGWGVNQDGKTNGITAPNAESQKGLEKEVYEKFGIDPNQIQLIEAHGTGTKLGDPIEVDALKQSFKNFTNNKEYCALGSVKSNIGHCMWAAGVAGFIKLIMSLKHKQLPPTINFEKLNEHITLDNSPFFVNDKLQDWNVDTNEKRHAAISSFGFSGTNAHVVIGEHETLVSNGKTSLSNNSDKYLIPVSAKNDKQLRIKAIELLRFLNSENQNIDIQELAYTLQIGREPMDVRLGFCVDNLRQLKEQLGDFIDGNSGYGVFLGEVHENKDEIRLLKQDEDLRETVIHKWIQKNKLSKLLEVWVKGLEFDWNELYGNNKPKRISLPLYPFAKERYWLETENPMIISYPNGTIKVATEKLHPLVHHNTSDFEQQRFSSVFTGEEFFLQDHQVKLDNDFYQKVLPGVAYLEMARTAVSLSLPPSSESSIMEIQDIMWTNPIIVDDPLQVSISLYENEEGNDIDFEIKSKDQSGSEIKEVIHCSGLASYSSLMAIPKHKIETLEARMTQNVMKTPELYEIFMKSGLIYGPAHQGIVSLHFGDGELLAKLRKPSVLGPEESIENFVLHPSLMDSALQSTVGLIADVNEHSKKPSVPFLLETLRVVSPCKNEMIAWIRYSKDFDRTDKTIKLDIDLCDIEGNICVQILGLVTRTYKNQNQNTKQKIFENADYSKNGNGAFNEKYHKEIIKRYLNEDVSLDDILELV